MRWYFLGPGGLTYSLWDSTSGSALNYLDGLAEDATKGNSFPLSFLASYTLLVPKGVFAAGVEHFIQRGKELIDKANVCEGVSGDYQQRAFQHRAERCM